jgi:hypothetical protein
VSEFLYCKRRATSVENERIRVIVTAEGGHIAAIIHKPTGVNPLWTPPWPSIEPSTYDQVQHAEYGTRKNGGRLSADCFARARTAE